VEAVVEVEVVAMLLVLLLLLVAVVLLPVQVMLAPLPPVMLPLMLPPVWGKVILRLLAVSVEGMLQATLWAAVSARSVPTLMAAGSYVAPVMACLIASLQRLVLRTSPHALPMVSS
jgi:hypothetical protein